MKKCRAEYCSGKAVSRGLCNKHYKRLLRHGDCKVVVSPRDQARTFYDLVVINYEGDVCLTWPFAVRDGYGLLHYGGRQNYVSRLVCEHTYGPPPHKGMEAAHSCGNGHLGCVNSRHLSWKTRRGNQTDRILHGTHNRGERCAQSKLIEEDVLKIVSLAGKIKQPQLAEMFGINQQSVSKILTGKNWSWLTGIGLSSGTQGLARAGR